MMTLPQRPVSRRLVLAGLAMVAPSLLTARPAAAAASTLGFGELYGKVTPLGLQFSDKTKALDGKSVSMRGFMAPPLKAEAAFFVLTEIPMSLCPFCSSDADWPDNIVVVYLSARQTFTQANQTIEVTGRLETGSWTDPETGFVSLLRLRDAHYAPV
ncbi:hypothetical protein SAMN05880590_111177 [Rhizobium sp. RU35A]|uniref:DUF3299 domain-containing protein n=1 Tax=Rhizobium straminoryzae TaxID=1387186 RepID=A0A549TEA6_9HYPH|nr:MULTISPECIES: hypothetical protein [Rhizobium]TRL40499.1 hypothetical protein FNA46_06285 [Rhizobium straminoryzae]SIR08465.1 hypothetical protein SAMN05880590_111177 [Rhizobium sp. RU35A]